MSQLVKKLAKGKHNVAVRPIGDDPVAELERRLSSGYVHVRFRDTKGGTELGVTLEPDKTDRSRARFDSREGSLTLVGTLRLDYVPVRCTAEIDLATLEGTGYLEELGVEEYERIRDATPGLN
jgi:hypothetical protein